MDGPKIVGAAGFTTRRSGEACRMELVSWSNPINSDLKRLSLKTKFQYLLFNCIYIFYLRIKYVNMMNIFMFVGVSVIEILEFNDKKKMKNRAQL